MTLAEYIRLTLLPQESEADKKAWKRLIRQKRLDQGYKEGLEEVDRNMREDQDRT